MKSLLNDILVLDLADEQGSFCSKLLADLGAAVIKVENLERNPAKSRNQSSFHYNNTNKLLVDINLKTWEGNRTFRSLIKRADVYVETFSAGELESLQFGESILA
jgi:crotonobetainyl-CoA:carnitine CoA-transferase CaiB-like acyl-CoA transferase